MKIAILIVIDSNIIIKGKGNDNHDENNAHNKDKNKKKIIKKKTKNKYNENQENTYNRQNTYSGRQKKTTYLLHPNYEKTTLPNMQRKHHVH